MLDNLLNFVSEQKPTKITNSIEYRNFVEIYFVDFRQIILIQAPILIKA